MKVIVLVAAAIVGCATPEVPAPAAPAQPSVAPIDAAVASDATVDVAPDAAFDAAVVAAPVDAAPPISIAPQLPAGDEVWLKGSTHVHALPSGDSREPIESVIAWYEKHGYDFIALTDHNRVSEIGGSTAGDVAVRAPRTGLIVLAGVELTHNPEGCEPVTHESGKCRFHVNGLGVTARPEGKLEWAERTSKLRIDMYQAAIRTTRELGGSLVQINHPNWFWGMTADLLVEIGRRGVRLVEIANAQFATWNVGDADHPSLETIWDAALTRGATVWGVASDDAHDYDELQTGKYPAGGGWVVVKARRDAHSILEALAAGRFYSSTGVTLARAGVDGEQLVIEVLPAGKHQHTIKFIENGKVVATVRGLSAKRAVPRTGYVRAVVTRDDGKQAWVQPARR